MRKDEPKVIAWLSPLTASIALEFMDVTLITLASWPSSSLIHDLGHPPSFVILVRTLPGSYFPTTIRITPETIKIVPNTNRQVILSKLRRKK